MAQREQMEYDLLIVGAGPAGLAAAIRSKQLSPEHTVCVIEKAPTIGSHILSGAVLDPCALSELLPQWSQQGAPLNTLVTHDEFLLLTKSNGFSLPIPSPMKNQGNYIISLGNLCQWLATQAEELGVEIYPGFSGHALCIEDNTVKGVITGDMGLDKQGNPKGTFQPGMALLAKQTLLAEGCRGSLSKQAVTEFHLQEQPQTYALGIKELWEIDPAQHKLGSVLHSVGWPLDNKTYGGSFLYHMENNLLSLGFVVGLDYQNPYLSPFDELQRFKTHPRIRPLLHQGKRIGYGARALVEGGYQALPKLVFPGGLLVGDAAGFLNVPRIKGTHSAMKSGMLAAETVFDILRNSEGPTYPQRLQQSWVMKELKKVRNIRPGFRFGLYAGLLHAALDTYVFRGHAPWTLTYHWDHDSLLKANEAKPINYPKPDNILTFDRTSSLYLSNVFHEENQPCHLQLKDDKLAIEYNLKYYAAPEQRYCPAGVYEIIQKDGQSQLQINAQNCIHCKTCDIKDPKQNINWVPPEGGGGPNYSGM